MMNPIHFDVILKNALIEDLLDEHAEEILNAERQEISFSRKYLEHKNQMLKNHGYPNKNLTGYAKVINVIALVSLIVLMAMAAGAALRP